MALAARHKRGRPLTPRAVPSRELIVHSARTVFNDVGYSSTSANDSAPHRRHHPSLETLSPWEATNERA